MDKKNTIIYKVIVANMFRGVNVLESSLGLDAAHDSR